MMKNPLERGRLANESNQPTNVKETEQVVSEAVKSMHTKLQAESSPTDQSAPTHTHINCLTTAAAWLAAPLPLPLPLEIQMMAVRGRCWWRQLLR